MVRIATRPPFWKSWHRNRGRGGADPPSHGIRVSAASGGRIRRARTLGQWGTFPSRPTALKTAVPVLTVRGDFLHDEARPAGSGGRFGPGRLDPIRRRSRFVMARAGFRPAHRRSDVADRNGDDAVRIPRRELVSRQIFAEAGHRVLVGLGVGAHVEIARWGIHAEAL